MTNMEKKMIGKSGLEASALSLGCWAIGGGEWWGNNDDQMSIDTICRAVQLGVNWIDTARVYGFGHSEEVVGKALKLLPRRKMILSTKCGIQWYDDGGELHFMKEGHAVRRDLAPKAIRRDLELSLKNGIRGCLLYTLAVQNLRTGSDRRNDGRTPENETGGKDPCDWRI